MAQERQGQDSGVVEIDLLGAFRKHLRLIIIMPLVTMVVVGIVAALLPDQYTAETTMYVLSRSDDSDSRSTSSSVQSDLSAGQMISNDVVNIIKSDRVKSDVSNQLGLDNLNDFDLDVTNSSDTRVITLKVTGHDAQKTADVANAIVSDVSNVASDVMKVESVNVIDEAKVPEHPSGPNRMMYTLMGLVIGFVAAYGIAVLREALNRRVTSDDDIEQLIDVPVIGHFQELKG